jgi:hypothetical protein
MAQLVARLFNHINLVNLRLLLNKYIATSALWVRIQTSPKNTKGGATSKGVAITL